MKYKVTWAPIVPPIVSILSQSPEVDKYDVSSFRGAISAAAPLGRDLIDAVQKRLPNLTITQAYGESPSLIHTNTSILVRPTRQISEFDCNPRS